MAANETQQTEKLIEEMLGFLDSSTDEEEENRYSNDNNNNVGNDNDGDENGSETYYDEDDEDDDDEERDSYESAKDEQNEIFQINDNNLSSSNESGMQGRSRNTLAKEIIKIRNSFPIWNTKEIVTPSAKRLIDPIWRQSYGVNSRANKYEKATFENDWNSKLDANCRRSGNPYVQEVNRAIYGDTNGHPPNGSVDYFQAAQNYAIYGKDFLDFPDNLTPLLNEKVVLATPAESNTPFVGGNSAYSNGLYPTPTQTQESTTNGVNFANFGKQLSASGASAGTYYQMCNGLQPSVRPGTATVGSTAYGMFLGNKITYVAAAPPAAPPPLVYNQHSPSTTNFISNSLANAALASSPAILYSNPMLTTTTQQYLNTFFKETQYLSGGTTAQGTATGTTGIYERLVYAQMLQQQIYHQTQQQAAAVAAMFQHKQRGARPNGLGTAASPPSVPVGTVVTATGPGVTSNVGLNLCARQAAMVNSSSSELLAKNVAVVATATGITVGSMTNGSDEIVSPVSVTSTAVKE